MRVLHIMRKPASPDLSELKVGYDLQHFKALSTLLEENHLLLQSKDGRRHTIKLGRLHVHLSPNLATTLLDAALIAARCHLIVALNPFAAGLIAIAAGWITLRPVLISVHGYTFTVSYAQWLLRRFVCLRSKLIRVNSRAVRRMVSSWGVDEGKMRLVSDRVDLSMFRPDVDCSEVRERLGLKWPTLLYVGSLIELKGVETLLKALPLVKKSFPDVKLLLVGDGPLRGRLMELAEELGVKDLVVFVGQVEHHMVPKFMAASTLLIHPSLSESLGRVLLEAQASGRPVVASRAGGMREALREGVTGLLFTPGDHLDLAEKVLKLLSNPTLLANMGSEARRFMAERFEFWRLERQLVKLYWEAVRGKA
jgi:glycosyltransferase involved in cell wall biosynthesis